MTRGSRKAVMSPEAGGENLRRTREGREAKASENVTEASALFDTETRATLGRYFTQPQERPVAAGRERVRYRHGAMRRRGACGNTVMPRRKASEVFLEAHRGPHRDGLVFPRRTWAQQSGTLDQVERIVF